MKVVRNVELKLHVKVYLKRSTDYDEFDKIRLKRGEQQCEIKKIHSTKLETEHGNGTYSSTRIFLIYTVF